MVMTRKERDEIMKAVELLKEVESILQPLVDAKNRDPNGLSVDVEERYKDIVSARKLLEWM